MRRSGVVSRDDLVKRLIDVPPDQTLVVAAPAGYGKTTTMVLWDEADRRPFAWVGLGPLDDAPVHLLQHIAAAFDDLDPIDATIADALARPGADPILDLLPTLIRVIDDRAPCVLVLDDTDHLRSAETLQCLDGLLSTATAGCQVALVGRSTPPLHLARRRMADAVFDLGTPDLVMEPSEAAAIFDHAGLRLGDDQVRALVDRTEGWAGGLHLAALALTRTDDSEMGWVFADGDRLVADYLMEEVLGNQAEETVAFLERSAVLDRMHAELLDELLDASDSGRRLTELEHSGNLFIVPVQGEAGWYRYHHLFSEFLRVRLRERDPQGAQRLEARASALLMDRGDVDGAIRHAVASGDSDRAADLILCQTLPMINRGQPALLRQWLDLLGPESASRSPAAAVAWAYYGHTTGDVELMKRSLADAESTGWEGPLADGSPSLEVALATLRSLTGWHGVEGVVRDTQLVRDAGPPPDNPWWGVATQVQGACYSMLGQFDLARDRLMESLETTAQAPVQEAVARAQLALLALHDDDLTEAERLTSQAVRIVDGGNLQRVLNTIPVFPISALVAARCGRPDDARRMSAAAREMVARADYQAPRIVLLTHLLLAKVALSIGDRPQARASAKDAERVRRREGSATYLNEQLDEFHAQLAHGDDGQAPEIPPITSAEMRVLAYLPTHLSLREIAEALYISRNTVKSHSVAIYRKLGVASRSEAVSEARRAGILTT